MLKDAIALAIRKNALEIIVFSVIFSAVALFFGVWWLERDKDTVILGLANTEFAPEIAKSQCPENHHGQDLVSHKKDSYVTRKGRRVWYGVCNYNPDKVKT